MKSKEIYAKWLEYSKENGIKTSSSQGRDPEDTDLISFINQLGLPKNVITDVLSNFKFDDSTQRKKERIKKTTNSKSSKSDNNIDPDYESNQAKKIFSPVDIEYIDKVKQLVDGFNKKTMKKMLGFLINGK